MSYDLPPGTSFCRIGDELIFLDVVADRYFGLPAGAQPSFLKLVGREPLTGKDHAVLRHLAQRGVLLDVPEHTRTPPLPCTPPPAPQTCSALAMPGHASWPMMGRVLIGLWWTELRLRRTSLRAVFAAVQRQKAGAPVSTARPERLLAIASAFDRTALIHSPHNRCLPQSIAVARSLLADGIAVDLVLGVKVRPFRAHCWVQAGGHVVNDTVDRVRDFTPILVI